MFLLQGATEDHTPRVSVVMPVYNVEQYLRCYLGSILGQTMPDWETIYVDDGSPDSSANIFAEHAEQDSRFRILTKENGSLPLARNVSTQVARGLYVNYMDPDDLIHPQTPKLALTLAERDGSDIASWMLDTVYKHRSLLHAKLRQPYGDAMPWNISQCYDLSKVHVVRTTGVIRYATDRRWSDGVSDPVRYFYTWYHPVCREPTVETPFIEGLKFEDFP